MSDTGLVLNSYTQYGKGNVPDAAVIDNGNQSVDLDEFYRESKQDVVDEVVEGMEQFITTGLLSQRLAKLYRMPNANQLDPIPSKRNLAVVGAEGFFSSVRDGIMSFIETIIKYIKMAVNWLVNAAKSLLGLNRSERQVAIMAKNNVKVSNEIKETLTGLGFPSSVFDMNAFTSFITKDNLRAGNLTLLVGKLQTEADMMEALEKVVPLFEKAACEMTSVSTNLKKSSETVVKAIDKARRNLRAKNTNGYPEVEEIKGAIVGISANTNFKEIPDTAIKIIQELYKVEFSDEELKRGFSALREIIAQQCHLIQTHTTHDRTPFIQAVAKFNQRYAEAKAASADADLSKIDFRLFDKTVALDDAKLIRELAVLTGDNTLVPSYQDYASKMQQTSGNYTIIVQTLIQCKQQIENIINWYSRSLITFYAYLYNDIETVIKINQAAKAQGYGQHADADGIPNNIPDLDQITLEGVKEHIHAFKQEITEKDLYGLKTVINRASKDLGMGNILK